MFQKCDVLILGAGVIGLSIGISLLKSRSNLKVIIAEKESSVGLHASGRNSGVLHAGFYYSPDSLKAKFCREGNFELRNLAKYHNIEVREVGKVVVTRNESEIQRLHALCERGIKNGVEVEIKDASQLHKFEPLAITHNSFLWSPTTAVCNPTQIIEALFKDFLSLGGRIDFDSNVSLSELGDEIYDDSNQYDAKYFVNAAGAQADRISRKVGVGTEYAMVPFIGMYRTTEESNLPLRRLVYPVPHPINPFLGVHFTLTIDKKVKIGPTAIPIFGREQYSLFGGWSGSDLIQSLKGIKSLVRGDAHDFGSILKSEWPKIIQPLLVKKSAELVPTALGVKKWYRKPPGIRAQLIHLPSGLLEQDFVVRSSGNATHVLNAVSPGWTSSLPFGRFITSEYILPKLY
ncbi:putative hydroxyglutarate oxidase [Candidatus Nanopelagicus abundans]|jgi:L-2-hydroxyglutarate oxidase|uniref:Putative hydroxyglutarate oxidase n=1 Tax=Candidatus Nanopelagicus abundans TaxID=1884916 RepID=A0A249L5Q8_9ACTN|nr:L-2-hydroxyglutarate oxidase [Candidatus Nanopelagicus abundans]ASY24337.1 putative hydroxyglutarate oxidase [Candidatus Nanopelagicus abundans]